MSDGNSAFAAAELGTEYRGGPAEHVRPFAGLVDDEEIVALLNHYDSLLDEDIENTRLGQQILSNEMTETVERAVQRGNVSQMKNAMGLTNNTKDEQELLSDVSDRLATEGTIGLVIGSPGSGKTALSLDVARMWAAVTGGTLIGNTEWEGFSEVVTSDQQMLEAMGSTEGQVLAVIDETAQDLSGFGEGMKPAEEFSDALTFVRKREQSHGPHAKQGSVLMISHTLTKVAKPFRDMAMFAVRKPTNNAKQHAVMMDSRSDSDDFEELYSVKTLTDTTESYREHESSEFKIHGVTDGEAEGDSGPDPETVKRNQQIRTVVEAVVSNGMSHSDASDLPGVTYSRGWVTDRVSEYENGEYRDLFDNPPAVDD